MLPSSSNMLRMFFKKKLWFVTAILKEFYKCTHSYWWHLILLSESVWSVNYLWSLPQVWKTTSRRSSGYIRKYNTKEAYKSNSNYFFKVLIKVQSCSFMGMFFICLFDLEKNKIRLSESHRISSIYIYSLDTGRNLNVQNIYFLCLRGTSICFTPIYTLFYFNSAVIAFTSSLLYELSLDI